MVDHDGQTVTSEFRLRCQRLGGGGERRYIPFVEVKGSLGLPTKCYANWSFHTVLTGQGASPENQTQMAESRGNNIITPNLMFPVLDSSEHFP